MIGNNKKGKFVEHPYAHTHTQRSNVCKNYFRGLINYATKKVTSMLISIIHCGCLVYCYIYCSIIFEIIVASDLRVCDHNCIDPARLPYTLYYSP